MIGSLRLTLILAAVIVAGISGLLASFWGATSPSQAAAQVQAQFAMAFSIAARAQPDAANSPLATMSGGALPGNTLYCPASGEVLSKGLFFVLVHPGPDKVLSTTCAQALTGQRQGDDLLKAAYKKDVGNNERVLGTTDWLPENYIAFKAGQLSVAGEILNFTDDNGAAGAFQYAGAGAPAFKLNCPANAVLVVGANSVIGPATWQIPSFCVDVDRTDLNLTQSEAQADCVSKGKSLISDDQFSTIAVTSMGGSNGFAQNSVPYDPVALGIDILGWPVATSYVGSVKGSSNPAYAKNGTDPNAVADPSSRRWVSVGEMGAPSRSSGNIWDFVGAPQWTSSRVPLEDIGKHVQSTTLGISQTSGYPDVGHLDRWLSKPASLDPALGVKNIGYVYSCYDTVPRAFELSPKLNYCNGWNPDPTWHSPYMTWEGLDAGWGGYYASTTPGAPLGITRGGPWAGTRMGSGMFAMAIVPVTERASHRCVVAPLERAGK